LQKISPKIETYDTSKKVPRLCNKIWLSSVEHSLSVMKDPGSNLGSDICSVRFWSVI
jgi:hypothetical protein